jgi:myo-inositol-1(or 4)-monophosphatase
LLTRQRCHARGRADPARDELYTAVKGQGAALNETPIRTSTCTVIEHALVGTAVPSHDSPQLPAYRTLLQALESKCGGLRRTGACALDLAYVGAGRLDGFWMTGGAVGCRGGALLVTERAGASAISPAASISSAPTK